jgi:hypothetical protein
MYPLSVDIREREDPMRADRCQSLPAARTRQAGVPNADFRMAMIRTYPRYHPRETPRVPDEHI